MPLCLGSLRKLQSLKHRLSGIRFLRGKKCTCQWFELTYSDAMLTSIKEYTWNQCDLSGKAFIHIKYEIHGHNLEECQAHEIISYPSLRWPFTMIEHMQYKSERETILFKTNKRDAKLFQFRVEQNCPYTEITMFNVNVYCYSFQKPQKWFPPFFHRSLLSILLLYICSFISNSSKKPLSFPYVSLQSTIYCTSKLWNIVIL